jgi:HEPN domain-containing protein
MQRLTAAEFLLNNGYNLDAMYLGGYAVECSLKALILMATPATDLPETLKKISSGSKMHDIEVLTGILKDLSHAPPPNLVKRFKRSGWSTGLRYEYGRSDTGETRGLLHTAKKICQWVEGELP